MQIDPGWVASELYSAETATVDVVRLARSLHVEVYTTAFTEPGVNWALSREAGKPAQIHVDCGDTHAVQVRSVTEALGLYLSLIGPPDGLEIGHVQRN